MSARTCIALAVSVLGLSPTGLGCTDPAAAPPVLRATAQPSALGSSGVPTPGTASAELPELPPPPAPDPPIRLATGGTEAVRGEAGMVTTVEINATRAAVAVLEKGGNAVDAAVTAAYVLAVTHPSAGNIGGGGFMIVRLANGESTAIDFRETAPAAATTQKVIAEVEAGAIGYASVAVPGTVAGLELAREKFGSKPRDELLAPAIGLAKKGYKLGPRSAQSLSWQWDKLKKDPAARAIFGKREKALEEGTRIVQKDLAATLQAVADKGRAGFYEGPVADAIEAAMKKNGGDITKADLGAYEAKLRKPLTFSYRGFTIETMPPPSMGGIAVAQTLLMLERRRAHEAPVDSAQSYHLFIESAKRAYAQRRSVGADPDFFGDRVPEGQVERMLTGRHLESIVPPIDPERATPAAAFTVTPEAGAKESPETTHFSVLDAQGNAVSCTVTLSASFGAKIVVPGTGVLLSNALGGFSPSGVNDAAPGKRMASSMSPTIVSRGGKTVLVVGSPGGDTIPNIVVQVLRNLIDYRMTVDVAVKRGRVHHQLLPDVLRTEKSNPPLEATRNALTAMGHTLAPNPTPLGDAKVIVIDEERGGAWGFADRREGGLALGLEKRAATAP